MRFLNIDMRAILKITILATALATSSLGCSSQTPATTSSSSGTQSTDSDTDDLSLSPSTTTLAPGATVTLTASGGVEPYTFYVTSGSGTVTTAGIFTAPSSEGYSVVMVYDAEGSYAYSSISIVTSSSTDTSSTGQMNVYRLYNNIEHFYSVDSTEGISVGYHYELVAFKVFTSAVSGSHGLYRCVTGALHFISTDASCEGQTVEGLYGYIYDSNVSGTSALYRFYKDGDHLVTTNYDEGTANGYTFESTLGYVPN